LGPLHEVHPPFRFLPARARQRLARHVVSLRVPKGERVFSECEPGTAVFILRQGRVTLKRGTCDGGARTLCVVGPGQIFCCLSILDGAPYPATSTASAHSIVDRLPREIYHELLEVHPEFARASLTQLGRQLRDAGCGDAPLGDTAARLAGRLLAMAVRFGDKVPLTRREFAELAGTTVETAIRQMKQFERAGWVRLSRGSVRLLDRRALCSRAGRECTPDRCPASSLPGREPLRRR
jgi:CRP-like cAMP-binding protein